MTTFIPSFRKFCTIPEPMPLAPPVTNATRPEKIFIGVLRESLSASLNHGDERRVCLLRHCRDDCRVACRGRRFPFTVCDDVELIVSDGIQDQRPHLRGLQHARKRYLCAASALV